jgi:hypothetical protein
MKLRSFLLIAILISISTFNGYCQEGSEEFQKIHEIIKPSVKEGFVWNTSQTWDSRFKYAITYDYNNSELNRLIYAFMPNAKEFSMMAEPLGGVEFEYEGRRAIYIDGSETGMSSISVLLNGEKGRFELSHRELESMATFSKDELIEILSKITMETLEN